MLSKFPNEPGIIERYFVHQSPRTHPGKVGTARNDAALTIKLRSLRVTRNLLAAGVLLLVSGAFASLVACIEPKGRYGVRPLDMLVGAFFFTTCGVGLLLPGVQMKLCASLLLVGLASWTFGHDAYRWHNLEVYALLLLPLLLILWLRHGLSTFGLQRLPDAR